MPLLLVAHSLPCLSWWQPCSSSCLGCQPSIVFADSCYSVSACNLLTHLQTFSLYLGVHAGPGSVPSTGESQIRSLCPEALLASGLSLCVPQPFLPLISSTPLPSTTLQPRGQPLPCPAPLEMPCLNTRHPGLPVTVVLPCL